MVRISDGQRAGPGIDPLLITLAAHVNDAGRDESPEMRARVCTVKPQCPERVHDGWRNGAPPPVPPLNYIQTREIAGRFGSSR